MGGYGLGYMPELLTISAYAKHRGVSQPAVSKAIQAGRITVVMQSGKKLIDPEVADIQWAKNTRLRLTDIGEEKQSAPFPHPGVSDIESKVYDIKAARAKREHHEANLAEMREREKAGQLLEADRVQKAATSAGALLRNAMEQIVSKVSSRVASVSDVAEVRALLTKEIDAALADAADNLRKLSHVDD